MITVDGLTKTFQVHEKAPGLAASLRSLFIRRTTDKVAVDQVSFTVQPGEIIGLLGANGAGKTTLVKMLSGVVQPTRGDAEVLGHRPWERKNAFCRQIGLVMGQKAQLWWDLPAADSFLLLKEIYSLDTPTYEQSLNELVDMLDARAQLNIQLRRLSLGERMKMELIATLLHRPKVVYLDEPTIGLDLATQRAVRDFILEYRERYQPAMLITSHYMEDIKRLCERVLVLKQGSLVWDGRLADLVAEHATHKAVTVHLEEGAEWSWDQGDIVTKTPDTLTVRVPHKQVPETAARLLSSLPVHDLRIEELDVDRIIEGILTG